MFFTAFATALSAVVIICSVFLILPQKNIAIEEKHYTVDHQEFESIDLTVLNDGLTEIYFDNRNYEEIKRYYDTFYNEILYYETQLVISEFENVLIILVPNKEYNQYFDHNLDKTDIVYGYELKYMEEYIDAGGFYECKVYGYMDTGAEKVYFTYNTYTMGQTSNFVNLVKDLVKKK